jgi:hypothetical protein
MKKTMQQLMDEFLESGGEIQKVTPVQEEYVYSIGTLSHKRASLMTLDEAELMFGVKTIKNKKIKVENKNNIDMTLIPDKIKDLILKGKDRTKEEN